jgi:hypothetical protein
MSTSSEEIQQRAFHYATAHGLQLERRLGFGRDGTVFATSKQTAVKAYLAAEPFKRELTVYRRLRDEQIDVALGHRVPRLLGSDEQLHVVEISIVKPPFVLDFAGAYLDDAPDFPPEVMEQWREGQSRAVRRTVAGRRSDHRVFRIPSRRSPPRHPPRQHRVR